MSLALPVALQNLLISSFALVDTLMVSQLGDVALSSVGMAAQWNWMLSMLLFGICSGAAVFIAQYWGIKDIEGIQKTIGIAQCTAVLAAAIFLIIAALAPRGVMRIFNRDAAVIFTGAEYLKIACFSYPAVAVSNVMSISLRCTERAKLPMYVAAITTALNALLNYGLIFGKFGLPALGVSGAAIATCISAWAGPLIVMVLSVAEKNILIAPLHRMYGFKLSEVRDYFKKAAPVIVNEAFWGLGSTVINVILANLGYMYYAAVTILRTFENVGFVFFIGLCSACSIMVGKSVGAGEIRQAREDSVRFVILMPLLAVVMGVIVILFRAQLVHIFNLSGNITAETVKIATQILLVYALEMPVRMLSYILIVGVFRSGGDTVTGMKMDLFSLWGLSIPVTFAAAFLLKLPFVLVFIIMYVLEDYPKALMCIRYFRTFKWILPVTEAGCRGLAAYSEDRDGVNNIA